MSDTMTAATTEQWMMKFYQQQPLMDDGPAALMPPIEGFSDATVVTTSPTPTMSTSEGILSPSSSSYTTGTSGGQLTPKGSVSKPIRRRSRASKRTPTTLLSANTTNFRALVQQFTGCPRTTMSVGVHKGPITLNFQQGTRQQVRHNTGRIIMPPFGNGSYINNNQVHQVAVPLPWQNQPPDQQLPHHQQQLFQEQQGGYSCNFLPSSANSRPSMEVSDGLLMNNDFSLNELTVNAFSNDIKNNDGYFM